MNIVIGEYKLYLDDERIPSSDWAKDGKIVIIARNAKQFKTIIRRCGSPIAISFDHDLGENEPTGYDIVKWLVHDEQIDLRNIEINVHSANPVGAENIRKLIESWNKHLDKLFKTTK
jgi:hypothetical protein